MITFIRHLIAAPVRLLAWANSFLHVFDPLKAAEVIWFLTRDADDGAWLVACVAKSKGLVAARERAESILTACRSAKIASVMGWLEKQENPDCIAAECWVRKAKALDCKDAEILLLLELSFAGILEDYGKEETIERMLSRNDLPMNYTSQALCAKAGLLAGYGQWDDAEAIADRVLCIEEQPAARFIKWVACSERGNETLARKHLDVMKRQSPATTYYYFLAGGMLMLDRREEAMDGLYQGIQAGLKVGNTGSPIGELYRSEDFAAYCRERGG